MKLVRKNLLKMVGSFALFLGALVIVPASLCLGHQPKCPDDLLK